MQRCVVITITAEARKEKKTRKVTLRRVCVCISICGLHTEWILQRDTSQYCTSITSAESIRSTDRTEEEEKKRKEKRKTRTTKNKKEELIWTSTTVRTDVNWDRCVGRSDQLFGQTPVLSVPPSIQPATEAGREASWLLGEGRGGRDVNEAGRRRRETG